MPKKEISQKYLSAYQNASIVETGADDFGFDDLDDIFQP